MVTIGEAFISGVILGAILCATGGSFRRVQQRSLERAQLDSHAIVQAHKTGGEP